jgi:hypothetical protein
MIWLNFFLFIDFQQIIIPKGYVIDAVTKSHVIKSFYFDSIVYKTNSRRHITRLMNWTTSYGPWNGSFVWMFIRRTNISSLWNHTIVSLTLFQWQIRQYSSKATIYCGQNSSLQPSIWRSRILNQYWLKRNDNNLRSGNYFGFFWAIFIITYELIL